MRRFKVGDLALLVRVNNPQIPDVARLLGTVVEVVKEEPPGPRRDYLIASDLLAHAMAAVGGEFAYIYHGGVGIKDEYLMPLRGDPDEDLVASDDELMEGCR